MGLKKQNEILISKFEVPESYFMKSVKVSIKVCGTRTNGFVQLFFWNNLRFCTQKLFAQCVNDFSCAIRTVGSNDFLSWQCFM